MRWLGNPYQITQILNAVRLRFLRLPWRVYLKAPQSQKSKSSESRLSLLLSGVAIFLFLATLTTGLWFALHHDNVRNKSDSGRATASLKHSAKAKVVISTVSAVPSAFDKELEMSPKELIDRWEPFIKAASHRFGVSEAWIRAVMRMESGGRTMLVPNQPITSSAGAMGIMQVMPETYLEMRQQYRLGADPYDPHDNIFAGTAYLRWLHQTYGYPAMFAAYNDGPGMFDDRVQQGHPLPTETLEYVRGITSILEPGQPGGSSMELAQLTRPDGSPVSIDSAAVESIRPTLPGEYPAGVQSVIKIGKVTQGVREDVATATAIVRNHGGGYAFLRSIH